MRRGSRRNGEWLEFGPVAPRQGLGIIYMTTFVFSSIIFIRPSFFACKA
jgi:hypothetical protein